MNALVEKKVDQEIMLASCGSTCRIDLVMCPACQESAYLPYVRQHLEHLKIFAGQETAADALVKSQKPKPAKKAKAKSKPVEECVA